MSREGCVAALVAIAGVFAPVGAQQSSGLVLNHLEIVLDSATWSDVRHSPFMQGQFAANDTSTRAVTPGMGEVFFGKYNFIVFGAAHRGIGDDGDVRIVLSTERVGAIGDVGRRIGAGVAEGRSALEPAGPSEYATVPGSTGRWLRLSDSVAASARTRLAIQEYGPDVAKALAVHDSLTPENLSMRRLLAPVFDDKRLFSQLVGATIAAPRAEIARISSVLERAGVEVTAQGESVELNLGGVRLHLIPDYTGAGVKRLEFALTRPAVANPTYRFGPKSQLRFGPGAVAVWDFEGH